MSYAWRVAGYSALGAIWWTAFMHLSRYWLEMKPLYAPVFLFIAWTVLLVIWDWALLMLSWTLSQDTERPPLSHARSIYLMAPLMLITTFMPRITSDGLALPYTLLAVWWVIAGAVVYALLRIKRRSRA
jgi:hypothetical protein